MFRLYVTDACAGDKVLRIMYSNGDIHSARCEVFSKGMLLGMLDFPSTSSREAFGYRYLKACLAPGSNEIEIRIVGGLGHPIIKSIEIVEDMYVGDWSQLQMILGKIRLPEIPERQYDIADFGAVGDEKTDNYKAFKTAIETCNSNGGGTINVPEGIFLINGPIHLRSNVHLHLSSKDTRILFGTNPEDYLVGPEDKKGCVLTSWEGTRLYNYSPAIYACRQENIAVTGQGTIDQQATGSWCGWRDIQRGDQKLIRRMNNGNTPLEERIFGRGHFLRPHMIQFYECSNILVDGLTLKDAGFWMIHPVLCRSVTVQDIKFKSNHLNNDGVDPEFSEYVLIKNIKFDNGDDNIAIKSGRDREGMEMGKSSSHIVVQNCSFNAYNAMTIGSEISGGVYDVYVEDCSFGGDVKSALYIKTNRDRGGETRRIRMRNLVFGDCTEGIKMETNYKGENTYNRTPGISDVKIENVFFRGASGYAVDVVGLQDKFIREISFENVFFYGGKGINIQYAEGVEIKNVWIGGILQDEKDHKRQLEV